MPASLRFVFALLALAFVAAMTSWATQTAQEKVEARAAAEAMSHGRVAAGKQAIERLGCGSCHAIPGVASTRGGVGPSLRGVALRSIIGGKLANNPDNLALWVYHPQRVAPGNAMPELPMTAADARNIAAYLLTLTS